MDAIVKKDVKLGVIGCGKMASAILAGVVKSGFLNSDSVFLFDTNIDNARLLQKQFNFNISSSLKDLITSSSIILIAIKPFGIDELLSNIKEFYSNQTIISILAGVKIEKYEKMLPESKIIRVMPNTPALVNEGASAMCSNLCVDEPEYNFAYELMKNCSRVIKTTEDKIDVITALSGSGPAFYFKIIELLAQSAQKLGLNKQDALLLSTQTALGASKMILENNFNIEQLIINVTTPGGCTEVGNNVLNNSNIGEIFDQLIKDTTQKAIELG